MIYVCMDKVLTIPKARIFATAAPVGAAVNVEDNLLMTVNTGAARASVPVKRYCRKGLASGEDYAARSGVEGSDLLIREAWGHAASRQFARMTQLRKHRS